MRTSEKHLSSSLKKQIVKTFAQVFSDLNTQSETEMFLNDFFTDSELETFSKRMAVAYWLKKGRSYTNIKQNLKVSSATIADISNLINSKGYSLGLKKIEAEEWANQWARKIKKFTGKFS